MSQHCGGYVGILYVPYMECVLFRNAARRPHLVEFVQQTMRCLTSVTVLYSFLGGWI